MPLDALPPVEAAARKFWGIAGFRPLQAEAIAASLAGRDTLVVMPTGGGKSLCYQLPAVVTERGVTVVVSPLIALMTDQVRSLRERGISAACLHSGQHPRDQIAIEQELIHGTYSNNKLIYVSPERLLSPSFLAVLTRCRIASFVIDEAHCISQWGHDFRPAYAALGNLRKPFPSPIQHSAFSIQHSLPIHAYTASATPLVRDEIVKVLGLRDPVVLVGDFDRPNLHLSVDRIPHRDSQLIEFVAPRVQLGDHGIVYCITRAETERVADMLNGRCGLNADAYHAGMSDGDRASVQRDFMAGHWDIIVATIAFGMGIDKPDIRWIVHLGMPSSLEVYHQEIGRAGRDGNPAECVILYHPDDYDQWEQLLWSEEEAVAAGCGSDDPKLEKLNHMDLYCRTKTCCRHAFLMTYFGQDHAFDNCAACDVCAGKAEG